MRTEKYTDGKFLRRTWSGTILSQNCIFRSGTQTYSRHRPAPPIGGFHAVLWQFGHKTIQTASQRRPDTKTPARLYSRAGAP